MTIVTPEQMAKSNTEHGHQAAIFVWASQNIIRFPELKWLFAIPNGGQRNAATGARLKAEGVKSGVPDIMLPVTRNIWHGLWIELKVGKNKLSKEQSEWLFYLQIAGYYTCVCYGWENAVNVIEDYLRK